MIEEGRDNFVKELHLYDVINSMAAGKIVVTEYPIEQVNFHISIFPVYGVCLIDHEGFFTYAPEVSFLGVDHFTIEVHHNDELVESWHVTVDIIRGLEEEDPHVIKTIDIERDIVLMDDDPMGFEIKDIIPRITMGEPTVEQATEKGEALLILTGHIAYEIQFGVKTRENGVKISEDGDIPCEDKRAFCLCQEREFSTFMPLGGHQEDIGDEHIVNYHVRHHHYKRISPKIIYDYLILELIKQDLEGEA